VVLKGPEDVKGAADAIRSLLDKPKAREKLSKAARDSVSKWTISTLVGELAEKVSARLASEAEAPGVRNRQEDTLEAKVRGGKKVVVTPEKLIVSSAKTNKLIAEVPYRDLVRIGRFSSRHWRVLAFGWGLSMALYGGEVVFPVLFAAAVSRMIMLPQEGTSDLLRFLIRVAAPIVPFLASLVVFFATTKKGYLVQFRHARDIFLEKEFGRALKVASSLKDGQLQAPITPSQF